jgi:NADH dehydrogenase [ubiquinone] 1 alpha subcomplex assembly factor 1
MLKIPALLLTSFFFPRQQQINYDFGGEVGANWQVIVDGVMGGLSTGSVSLTEHSMVFTGVISLANNGGFSSWRAPFGTYDLSPYQSVEIRYRSRGGDFTFMLEEDRRFWIPYFSMTLPDSDEEWTTLRLDLEKFDVRKLGEQTGKNMQLTDRSEIIRMGFMKLDKQAGPFVLEVDYITFK